MLKIILKVIGIGVVFILTIVLIEYAYANRWILYKSVPQEEYKKMIIGEWMYSNYNPFVFNREDELIFVEQEKIFYQRDGVVEQGVYPESHLNWSINSDIIYIKGIIYPKKLNIPCGYNKEYCSSLKKEVQEINKNNKITFLNKDYLVLNEVNKSVRFPFIPRKKFYKKIEL